TGRFGRKGQVDYAVANEVLNKLAQVEARRRANCRVVSVNWGPWNGGMVTPSLRKVFEQEGVGLIDLAAGADYLVRELSETSERPVEVVVMARPQSGNNEATDAMPSPESAVIAFEREVSVGQLPCLASHVLDGHAVLPVALIIEWLSHGALHGNPGMTF